MKGKFTIAKKFKAIIALVIVFLMILATNMMDNKHFAFVQESFESIYKDRLVVNDYIFRIARLVEAKREKANSLTLGEKYLLESQSSDSIDQLIINYTSTKLSRKEEMQFSTLKEKLNTLSFLEAELAKATDSEERNQLLIRLNDNTSSIIDNLETLSSIQLDEARGLFHSANRLIDISYLNSRLEIAFLIIIGSAILTLIMIKPSS